MTAPVDPIAFWNGEAGSRWVQHQAVLDRALGPFGLACADAARIAPGERVVDVGCGCGDTTLVLAERVGDAGKVLGLDVSAPMLARARERAAGRREVDFLLADASFAPLDAGAWDLVFSRFGVMFFADRARAFAHLGRALGAAGRLAFVCWRTAEEAEFLLVPLRAALGVVPAPEPAPAGAPGAFQLADRAVVVSLLQAAGFSRISVEPFDHDVMMGTTLEEAVEFAMQTGPVSGAIANVDERARASVRACVRDALAPHARHGRVELPGGAWIVTASASRDA